MLHKIPVLLSVTELLNYIITKQA